MRERLPTRPALVTSRRGARTLKNTRSECTACSMLNTCSIARHTVSPPVHQSTPALFLHGLVRSRKHGIDGSQAVKGCRNFTRHERRKIVSSSDTSVRMSKPSALNFGKCTKIALHSQAM